MYKNNDKTILSNDKNNDKTMLNNDKKINSLRSV